MEGVVPANLKVSRYNSRRSTTIEERFRGCLKEVIDYLDDSQGRIIIRATHEYRLGIRTSNMVRVALWPYRMDVIDVRINDGFIFTFGQDSLAVVLCTLTVRTLSTMDDHTVEDYVIAI